ncbi:zinc finger domain-containing protein [Brevibacterium casei]|uniref:DNA-binding phage zinc finger domain-containing protein n=1 Tax=Brevibacterium casei CIP 102111 TaxID=1255625 RepID=A0A2H1K562_9MICO|nr:hypothetical protein BC102111_02907 [Brevibacterium casei CIP 102111]
MADCATTLPTAESDADSAHSHPDLGPARSIHVPKRSKLFDLVEAAKSMPCPICRSKRGSWCRGNLGYPTRIFDDCYLHVVRLEAAILADDSRKLGQSTIVSAVASAGGPLSAQDRTDASPGGEDHA